MKYYMLVLLILMQGCQTTTNQNYSRSEQVQIGQKEKVYLATNNSDKLIDFYKSQLKVSDSRLVRRKLANVYLSILDAESALFVINPVIKGGKADFDSYLVAGKSHMELGNVQFAKSLLDKARVLDEKDGEVCNLLGIIYADEGNLHESRKMFELARNNFYDDVKVKNNLALLDIIEGDKKQALQRIYSLNEEQKNDDKIKSNLLFIMAKNGNKNFVVNSLDKSLSDLHKQEIYVALKESDYVSLYRDKSRESTKQPVNSINESSLVSSELDDNFTIGTESEIDSQNVEDRLSIDDQKNSAFINMDKERQLDAEDKVVNNDGINQKRNSSKASVDGITNKEASGIDLNYEAKNILGQHSETSNSVDTNEKSTEAKIPQKENGEQGSLMNERDSEQGLNPSSEKRLSINDEESAISREEGTEQDKGQSKQLDVPLVEGGS